MWSKLMRPIHRPRLSVANLMILIAIVGLVLGGARWIDAVWPEVLIRRAEARKHDVAVNRWKERVWWTDAESLPRRDASFAECQNQMEYHERMRRKWSWGSWFPWMPVERDGPAPPSNGAFESPAYSGMY